MAVFHKFYLVHSWTLCPICDRTNFQWLKAVNRFRKKSWNRNSFDRVQNIYSAVILMNLVTCFQTYSFPYFKIQGFWQKMALFSWASEPVFPFSIIKVPKFCKGFYFWVFRKTWNCVSSNGGFFLKPFPYFLYKKSINSKYPNASKWRCIGT